MEPFIEDGTVLTDSIELPCTAMMDLGEAGCSGLRGVSIVVLRGV
jgi:hypothetical protein